MCSTSVKRTSSRIPARRPPSWKYTSLSASAAISCRRWSLAPYSWASKRRAAYCGGKATVRWRIRSWSVDPIGAV
ncbi:hypothetical protein OK006_10721 [Actinobacteria bacterium OK006]|nr:hypothetical protein OK006_10721 [Actinobacteria bacterium OK006]